MRFRQSFSFIIVAVAVFSPFQASAQAHSTNEFHGRTVKHSSPFSLALDTLQKKLRYDFQNIGLLRRAMTHPSYSEENNRALAVLGASLIETTFSLKLLTKDVDISAKDLNRKIADISKVEASCSVDGVRLGLQNVVRVSPKTNSSTPAVVCGAFRAVFGAIAVDAGKSDDAGTVFWNVHVSDFDTGRALAI